MLLQSLTMWWKTLLCNACDIKQRKSISVSISIVFWRSNNNISLMELLKDLSVIESGTVLTTGRKSVQFQVQLNLVSVQFNCTSEKDDSDREKSSDRRQKPSHTKPFVCGVYWGIVSVSEHDRTCLDWVRVDTLRTFGQGEFKEGGSRPVPLRDVLYFTVRPRPRR